MRLSLPQRTLQYNGQASRRQPAGTKPRRRPRVFRSRDRVYNVTIMDRAFEQSLIAAATAVLEPTEVFLAYAFGSRISGRPGPESDLDIGYYLNDFRRHPPLPICREMDLADRLSKHLGLEVDLRDLGRAPLEVRGRVLEQGVRIYCSDEVQRVNLERDLLSRYLDYKDIFRRMHDLRLEQFARRGLSHGGSSETRQHVE